MADSTQVKELTSKLEQGVKDLFNSETYANYLRTMASFHKYSTRNTLLIHMQKPEATHVAGFSAWQTNFNRHVKKGEKAIKIFAPIPLKITKEMEKIDPETQRPIIGENGEPIREEIEIKMARFKIVNVFDISQTDGEPLPRLVQDLTGNVEQYEAFVDALRAVSPLPITFEPLPNDTDGKCIFGDKIVIREGMSEVQTVSAIIHEIAHAKLHDLESIRQMGENATPKDRRTEEVEAEAVAFSTNAYFGIDTSENSFGYIAEWSQGRELKELNASLDTIRKATSELIDGIDAKFQELVKERNINLGMGEPLEYYPMETPIVEPPLSEKLAIETPSIEANIGIATVPANAPTPAPDTDILMQYIRHAQVASPQRVGAGVLMTPVFDDGNFNRTGKKIRVTVEEPIGKYQIYSRDEHDKKQLYFLAASGRIDRTSEYFRDEYNETAHKWENKRPTEVELDEMIPLIAAQFAQDMAKPTKWAKYQHAAVVNRLDDCDAHNIPVRELRNAETEARRVKAAEAAKERELRFQEKFDARVNEIANAISEGKTISVDYHEYDYGGKNPVLELFKLYNINLPLRTQGWVNTGLAEITKDSYRYYKNKHKGNSTVISDYLDKLREAIKRTPIEQKRNALNPQSEVTDITNAKLYAIFAELFPAFAQGDYSHIRLETGSSMMPLSLEHLSDDRISVMHTYELNGDLCYDPMMEFHLNRTNKTLEPVVFEQSIPPIYQYMNDNGTGTTVDGNGNEKTVWNLQYQLKDFATMWFANIEQQGYMPVRGTKEIDGEDVKITFDAEGKPITPEKEYDLGYGFLGNGITVWNRAEEKNGDYVTVAHIATDRTVSFYDKDMPHEIKQKIDTVAKSSETRASGFSPAPESIPPRIENDPGAGIIYEIVKKSLPETAELRKPKPDILLPDPTINIADMNNFGYEWEGMLPLTGSWALQLYDSNVTVYLLYPDNTEAMVYDRAEIENHEDIFGVEVQDWKNTTQYAKQLAELEQKEARLESELLHSNGNRFGIYQISDETEETQHLRFLPMKDLEDNGLTVNRTNYELVYTAPFTERIEFLSDRYPVLNNIYSQFNTAPPEDFTGRSVSVSDVIVLKYGSDTSTHFVDATGFKELDNYAFHGEDTGSLYQADTRSDENTIPSVATLEADVKAGKVISLTELAKATHAEKATNNHTDAPKPKLNLMERLKQGKQKAAQQGQPDTHKNKQREVE